MHTLTLNDTITTEQHRARATMPHHGIPHTTITTYTTELDRIGTAIAHHGDSALDAAMQHACLVTPKPETLAACLFLLRARRPR